MHYSPESLQAFVQTVESGSFSAAARALRKSQSTISAAVANLEADLGVLLFSRESRAPRLTAEGQRILVQVREIISATAGLEQLAIRLAGSVEPWLGLATSDFWQTDYHASLLASFSRHYPLVEFECMMAEDGDIVDLLQSGRAHVGVIRAQQEYPADIVSARLAVTAQMAVYIQHKHPLAQLPELTFTQLRQVRQLCLNTWIGNEALASGNVWKAPSYWLLMEMAIHGHGWTILPRWMVNKFADHQLCELPLMGWPQHIAVDVIWSQQTPPGPAGCWMIDHLLSWQELERLG
ncbi:MAG: HTH-type transcriptional activator AllS [Candidatus Erwinia impunctatus]|nr:HTH-type transcriptional activator AllS [Culicoides impunctatus]